MKKSVLIIGVIIILCGTFMLRGRVRAEDAQEDAPEAVEAVNDKVELSITNVTEDMVNEAVKQFRPVRPDITPEEIDKYRFETATRLCDYYWSAYTATSRCEKILSDIESAEVKYKNALNLPEDDETRSLKIDDTKMDILKLKKQYINSIKAYNDSLCELQLNLIEVNPLVAVDREIVLSSPPYIPTMTIMRTIDDLEKYFSPELLKKEKIGIFDKTDLALIGLKVKALGTYIQEYIKANRDVQGLRKKLAKLESGTDKKEVLPDEIKDIKNAISEALLTTRERAADVDRIVHYTTLARELIEKYKGGDDDTPDNE